MLPQATRSLRKQGSRAGMPGSRVGAGYSSPRKPMHVFIGSMFTDQNSSEEF